MDVKAEINKVVEKVTKDPSFKKDFENDPVKAVEKVLGVDLPDDVIHKIIDGVKAKLSVDSLSNAADAFKKLF